MTAVFNAWTLAHTSNSTCDNPLLKTHFTEMKKKPQVLFNSYKVWLTKMIFYQGRSLCSLIDLCALFLRHTMIKVFMGYIGSHQNFLKGYLVYRRIWKTFPFTHGIIDLFCLQILLTYFFRITIHAGDSRFEHGNCIRRRFRYRRGQ